MSNELNSIVNDWLFNRLYYWIDTMSLILWFDVPLFHQKIISPVVTYSFINGYSKVINQILPIKEIVGGD